MPDIYWIVCVGLTIVHVNGVRRVKRKKKENCRRKKEDDDEKRGRNVKCAQTLHLQSAAENWQVSYTTALTSVA